jgi:hypothetical protein
MYFPPQKEEEEEDSKISQIRRVRNVEDKVLQEVSLLLLVGEEPRYFGSIFKTSLGIG